MKPASGRPSAQPPFGFVFHLVFLCFCIAAPTGAAAEPAPVRVEVVQREAVEEVVELSGSITPLHAATLSTAVAGLVTARHVDVGDQVETGDRLLELDPELVRLAAEGASARAREARTRLEDARRRLAESQQLRDAIAASEVASLEAEVEQAEAMLAAALADEAQQGALLRRHRLRAPFAGIISARSADVGEWLEPGASVFGLVGSENLRADFQVSQSYLHRIDDRARLSVRQEDGAGNWEARILRRVPVLDARSRTFLLRASVPAGSPFVPGMAVRARLALPAADDALTVSRDALIRYPDGRVSVWLVTEADGQDVAVERAVMVAPGLAEKVVVRDGLSAGDRVIIRGNESLSAGQPVRVLP